jgi:dTDP-4-amino-4,6-dideoxygalactose transaminase
MQTTEITQNETAVQPFPFLDLKAQYRSIKTEIDDAILRVMESQTFILGPEVESLEKEIASYTDTEFGVSCASGSDALLLSLMCLDAGPGDEVITTPFTFVATAGSIARLRARPVFVDIEPDTYNLDPEKLAAAITPKTKAILPVHLFGMASDLDRITEIAKKQGIPVIEDAAQAIGATYAGRPVGGIGDFGCFSFFPSKNLGGFGDGGLVTTRDRSLAEKLRVLRTHGSSKKYTYDLIGMNSRLDALQAAILRVKLRHLDAWAEKRQRNAARYARLFQQSGLDQIITLPRVAEKCNHVYNQYVIRVPKRDALQQHLRSHGIPTEIYYPSPLHLQRAFAYLGYHAGDLPVSEAACQDVLAISIFPDLTTAQQDLVVGSIESFYRN